jgi:hypothetical protein
VLISLGIFLWLLSLGMPWGRNVIKNPKLRNLENVFNGITAAIYSYQDRYHFLPGDVNRNGKIDGTFDSTISSDESRLLWLHLRQAELVAGDKLNDKQPINLFNGLIGVSTDIITADDGSGISGLFIGFTNIPGDVAIKIESRGDDGKPNSGDIHAQKITSGVATNIENYSENGLYNLYFLFGI